MSVLVTNRWATLSEDGRYRYLLGRSLDPDNQRSILFIMLNPSTADANVDDPTIRRCLGFAKRDGYGTLEVVNLYALRSTDPDALARDLAPIGGPLNDRHINHAVAKAETVVYAWGSWAPFYIWRRVHDDLIKPTGKTPMCLGQTKYGQPRHPLYIKGTQPLVPFVVK